LEEVKMLASILRCFPNVDTLHIEVTFGVLHIRSVIVLTDIHIVNYFSVR
jgi:hypothetical protein